MTCKFNRREFLRNAVVAGGLATLGPSLSTDPNARGADEGKRRRPNLLIVFPDQMRAHAQGFMHEDPAITPNLDRLAAEGVVFTHAVSNYPVCSPFRAMLMTGK